MRLGRRGDRRCALRGQREMSGERRNGREIGEKGRADVGGAGHDEPDDVVVVGVVVDAGYPCGVWRARPGQRRQQGRPGDDRSEQQPADESADRRPLAAARAASNEKPSPRHDLATVDARTVFAGGRTGARFSRGTADRRHRVEREQRPGRRERAPTEPRALGPPGGAASPESREESAQARLLTARCEEARGSSPDRALEGGPLTRAPPRSS